MTLGSCLQGCRLMTLWRDVLGVKGSSQPSRQPTLHGNMGKGGKGPLLEAGQDQVKRRLASGCERGCTNGGIVQDVCAPQLPHDSPTPSPATQARAVGSCSPEHTACGCRCPPAPIHTPHTKTPRTNTPHFLRPAVSLRFIHSDPHLFLSHLTLRQAQALTTHYCTRLRFILTVLLRSDSYAL